MLRPFSLFVGLRYTAAKRRNHFISFISMVSILGIALGVMVLITVLSVMNGFDEELKERILGMAPHVTVYGYSDAIQDWREIIDKISQLPGVNKATAFVEGQAMITRANLNRYALISGIDASKHGSELQSHIVAGELSALKPGEFGIVLGKRLATSLAANVGDKVTLVIPDATFSPAGVLPRLKRFKVVAIFEIGYNYDSSMAFIQINDAQKLYRLPSDGVTGIHLSIDDLYAAPRMANVIAKQLQNRLSVTDWTKTNGNFFQAVKLEKTLMFVLLLFIVLVAAFNILATLIMLVTEKKADIAILRTLGASPGCIMRIFFVQGTVIGVVGTLLGTLCGLYLALNITDFVSFLEGFLHQKLLSADVYYISFLPSSLHWQDVLSVAAAAMLMSFTFTLYPAYKASQTSPAEALRYE